jgi:hypothetical protein
MRTDSTTRAVNPDAVLKTAATWGQAQAVLDIRAGHRSPRSPLSGEWAGDLTPADIYHALIGPDWDGGRPRWVDADTGLPFDTEFFLTEICDAFENAYDQAEWPEQENDHA